MHFRLSSRPLRHGAAEALAEADKASKPISGVDLAVPALMAYAGKMAEASGDATADVLADGTCDGLPVTRRRHEGCDGQAEVVLVTIDGGGHTWPGRRPPVWFIGKSTLAVAANDLMWEFFSRHPLR